MEWGFEHFEFAYRLFCKGYNFSLNRLASNYHIPHPRTNNFYNHAIFKNAEILCKKHPTINEEALASFISGKIDIDNAEMAIYTKE